MTVTLNRHLKTPVGVSNPNLYITFQGSAHHGATSFKVMCGDNPPTITGGYAKWQSISRPLQRAVTVFQGYDPYTMHLELRFGVWSDSFEWQTDNHAGGLVEADIERLEWMAGAGQDAGPSPYVYINTFGRDGTTTSLIPAAYQQTVGVNGSMRDTKLWPWVITGIQWGRSLRNSAGLRVLQECSVDVMAYQSFSNPPHPENRGSYYKVTHARNTVLKIATDPRLHALRPSQLADQIKKDKRNNPVRHTHLHLDRKGERVPLPVGSEIWVPGHQLK